MKGPFLVAMLFSAAVAGAGEVGIALPPGTDAPDTESSTNIVLGAYVGRTDVFSVALSLTATPSNNVELVFFEDSGSGQEAAFAIGWDCGSWFLEGPTNRFEAAFITQSDRKTLSLSARVDDDGCPISVSLTESGAPLSVPGLPPLPEWCFSKRWDTLSVVQRGFGPTGPAPEVRFDADGISVLLR